ncbi:MULTISPECIES: N-acetyltransferase [Aeromonas]|uniref:N-acetyltransferase n=1 Tax=Aeromonas sp. WP2-W18-CRE-05 TaxID=2675707 RepID=UPI0015DC3D7A|nr:N-acetyltransferase [Aeromonas sp. WP2-W18-CRE-05]BBQ26144.1 hypothetical protein WP2W18C05_23600 [Aeromonas sp. WP2-W18-CRE-05]
MDNLKYISFANFDHNDVFFDSLKMKYAEFSDWLNKKADNNEFAYVLYGDKGIDGFMYLKIENSVEDVSPPLPLGRHLKIGTFKFNARGTLRGQRFLKKAFDFAIRESVDDIYVTVFAEHESLIGMFKAYGFQLHGMKETANGTECVFVRNLHNITGDVIKDYPLVIATDKQKYMLGIYPEFHTRLFPDSILKNENASIVEDVSHANSIHKVYLCAMRGVMNMHRGDVMVIYRTSDNMGPARFRAVATSVCVIEEVKSIREFSSLEEFIYYCSKFSIFTQDELISFYKTQRYPFIIKFTYNIAFNKRPNRATLIEDVGLNESDYWGFMSLSDTQFARIVQLGEVDEGLVIN